MKIAILTDSHDNHPMIERAKTAVKEQGCERIIFCGDLGAPSALIRLGEAGLPVDMVFGNNDGERFGLLKAAQRFPSFTIHGDHNVITLDGRHIFLTHYPLYARHAAMSGLYDAAFYGHLHDAAHVVEFGRTILAHPGTLMSTTADMSYGIYDTATNSVVIVKLTGPIGLDMPSCTC